MKLNAKHIRGLITINAAYTGTAAGLLAGGVFGSYSLFHSIIGVILFSIPGVIATLVYMKKLSVPDKDDPDNENLAP